MQKGQLTSYPVKGRTGSTAVHDELVVTLWTLGSHLGMFFGETEGMVMDYLWSVYPLSVSILQVLKHFRSTGHFQKYTTIAATTNRLVEKGFIVRSPRSRPTQRLVFKAAVRQDHFVKEAVAKVVRALMDSYPDQTIEAVAWYQNTIETDSNRKRGT